MNIDERLAFLLQSTESLHESVQQNTANIEALTARIDQLTGTVETDAKRINALITAIEIDAANIRSLANIAGAHEDRISKLEGGA